MLQTAIRLTGFPRHFKDVTRTAGGGGRGEVRTSHWPPSNITAGPLKMVESSSLLWQAHPFSPSEFAIGPEMTGSILTDVGGFLGCESNLSCTFRLTKSSRGPKWGMRWCLYIKETVLHPVVVIAWAQFQSWPRPTTTSLTRFCCRRSAPFFKAVNGRRKEYITWIWEPPNFSRTLSPRVEFTH